MKSDACCARPGSDYQCKPGELATTLPCEGGTLRIGVFQDGTGNSMEREDRYSNVAKLARVYRIDTEHRAIRWAYARGVGTDPGLSGDLLGNAFGKGAPQRLDGLLHAIQVLIDDYRKETGALPTRIVLDGFGFSRGAAMIRHFINCIKQGHFELDGPYRSIPKDAFRIGFLGVYESVASFGMPGNNRDTGYTFHVPLHWLEDGGLHLVADDEHRANFDLQAMLQSDEHPQDRTDGKFKECVLPGAHSDVGGGYASVFTQGQSNNMLGRVALGIMYETAKSAGLPIDKTQIQSLAERNSWTPDPSVVKAHEHLFAYYRSRTLRLAHRRWRTLRVAEELALRDLKRPNSGEPHMQALRKEREAERLKHIRTELNRVEKEIRACFSALYEYDDFMDHAEKFYARWVHKSYSPHNTTPGMEAQRRGTFRERCHREVFLNGHVDITRDRQFRKLVPRPFKDGVWIDQDCLAQFKL